MAYVDRIELFRKYESLRNRPLIAYVTSVRPNLNAPMAGDSIPCIIKQIEHVPKDKKEIDFLIISNGGDPITSLRTISALRERFEKITVVVPYVAYSAATVLALGADEILMHPFSNLGPVDPQITAPKQNETGQISLLDFSSEDVRNYIEFVKTDVGITDQAQLITAFDSLAKEVGPLLIGKAKRGQQLSVSLSIKLLETHMHDTNKATTIVKSLNSEFYHHGYAVGRTEAKNIGLDVLSPPEEIEKLIWEIWQDYSAEMKCDTEFNPITEIMNDPDAKTVIECVPVLSLPVNAPQELSQSIILQLLDQNTKVMQQNPIEITSSFASIDSVYESFSYKLNLNIIYWRDLNMNLSFNITNYSDGWISSKEQR